MASVRTLLRALRARRTRSAPARFVPALVGPTSPVTRAATAAAEALEGRTLLSVAVKVNFQPAASPVPAGHVADAGAAFATRGNGYSYGWDADNTADTRDRAATVLVDNRYRTLNHMQLNGASRSWELEVPNGSYQVRVVGGDPAYSDGTFAIDAEGAAAVRGTPSNTNNWVEGTATVTVADGRLTLTNAPAATNNKLCFVEVTSTDLLTAPAAAPAELRARAGSTTAIDLVWRDNTSDEAGFEVQRRVGTGAWATVATTGGGPEFHGFTQLAYFNDSGRAANTAYGYRVRAVNAAGASAWSNETAVTTPATIAQAAYGGTPWQVGTGAAGKIQAEDFDTGGQNTAYNDLSGGNTGNLYRATGVDVGSHAQENGGYFVGWNLVGEWLEYTIDVARAGSYRVEARVGRPTAGGTFHVEFGGTDRTGPIAIPATGSYYTFTTVAKAGVPVAAGLQVMRVKADTPPPFGTEVGNIDWLRLVPEQNPGDPPTRVTAAPAGPGSVAVSWSFAGGGGAGGAGAAANVFASSSAADLFNPGNRVASGVAASQHLLTGLTDGQPLHVGVRPALPGGGEGAGTVANNGSAVVPGPFATPATGTPGAWPRYLPDPRPYDGSTSVPAYPTRVLSPVGSGPQVLVSPVPPTAYRGQRLLLGAKLSFTSSGDLPGANYGADYIAHRGLPGGTFNWLDPDPVKTDASVLGGVTHLTLPTNANVGPYYYTAYAVGGQPYGSSPMQEVNLADGPDLLVTDRLSGIAQRDATPEPGTLAAGTPADPFPVTVAAHPADGTYRGRIRLDIDADYLDLQFYTWSIAGPNGTSGGTFDARQPDRAVEAELLPGQTYTVRLAATGYSRELTVAVDEEPPVQLSAATESAAAINLTWAPHTWQAAGFVVERTTDPAGEAWERIATLPATATSYRDASGLVGGTTYHYRVRPTIAGGVDGPNSTPASAVAALPAPTDLAIGQNDADLSLTFAWAYPAASDARFTVERSVEGGPFEPLGTTEPNVTTYRTPGPLPAGRYAFRVVATRAAGSPGTSGPVDVVLPPAVGKVAAVAVAGVGAVVAWPAASAGATGYRVHR